MKTEPGLKLTVTLPDGTKETRTTHHDYTHVCAFRVTDNRGVQPWGAQWSATQKGAEAMARKWHNSEYAKKGIITVETQIIQVWA
jgi:chorismate synthase